MRVHVRLARSACAGARRQCCLHLGFMAGEHPRGHGQAPTHRQLPGLARASCRCRILRVDVALLARVRTSRIVGAPSLVTVKSLALPGLRHAKPVLRTVSWPTGCGALARQARVSQSVSGAEKAQRECKRAPPRARRTHARSLCCSGRCCCTSARPPWRASLRVQRWNDDSTRSDPRRSPCRRRIWS
jgi:hypothetical protein